MKKGLDLHISGPNAIETGKILAARLIELGRHVEMIDAARIEQSGGLESAERACGALVRDGVIVIITVPRWNVGADGLAVMVDEHDTPDFAAEKIIDTLADAGIVSLQRVDYTPEEEEQIRRRLQGLGYIE